MAVGPDGEQEFAQRVPTNRPTLRHLHCCTGNGGSLDKCRRRWDLAEDEELRYKYMYAFDRAMNHLDKVWQKPCLATAIDQGRGPGRQKEVLEVHAALSAKTQWDRGVPSHTEQS